MGKLEAENQRRVEKYSSVNRTIQLWNHLPPAVVLGNVSCKPSNFRKKVRKVIHEVK
jgi:hypothetical protein